VHFLYLKNDSEITPWIICPDPNCSIPLHHKDILSSDGNLTLKQLLQFICEYMRKKIVRNENFICCKTKDCKSGFLQFKQKKETVKCELCNEKQVIEKGVDGELDKEFKDMIAKGTLRECPGLNTDIYIYISF
jgi:aspartate carbamoyltransferase regulatory subunit